MTTKTLPAFKTVCIAIWFLFMCEAGALFLPPFLSPIAGIGLTRSVQIALLVLLLSITPTGFISAGLGKQTGYAGFKTGVTWASLFGAVVLAAGSILYLAGIDPFRFFQADLARDNRMLFFLVGGIIGPIAEELFFRGILYSFLRRLGILTAVGVSTLIFALFHLSSGGLPVFQIVGGIVFALSFERSQSLAAPIIIHVSGNLAIFTITLMA